MNLKSNILKIAVVIALIFMLLPVIAAEDVDDSVYTDSNQDSVVNNPTDVPSDDLTADSDDDVADANDETDDETDGGLDDVEVTTGSSGLADLEVVTVANVKKANIGDIITFAIMVGNNGPDTATNVIVKESFLSGDVFLLYALPSQGQFDPYLGIWDVGDLEAGEVAVLYLMGEVVSYNDVILMAVAVSDTPDPNPYNNMDFVIVDVVNAGKISEPATMPEAGNPIALALLALMSIVGVSFKRKF